MAPSRITDPIVPRVSWSQGIIIISILAHHVAGSELGATINVAGSMPQVAILGQRTAFNGTYTAVNHEHDLEWYPPRTRNINNLTKVSNDEGVWGFIYDKSTTPKDEYGTYNWCNMPHVRATEYLKPSNEYNLEYVEVIHRHHKRTPYAANAFPIESDPWHCDDVRVFHYGEPQDGKRAAARGFWNSYQDPVNPFKPSGFRGSCRFPQLTAGGLIDSWQHGRDLYEVYHDMLDFLPDEIDGTVAFRVTSNGITSQVAGMVINGMFGTQAEVSLLIQDPQVDSLEPLYPCEAARSIYSHIISSAAWQQHLAVSAALFQTLDDLSGVAPSDPSFHISFDHYYDNLSSRQCHGRPLPCSVSDPNACISQEQANHVYRLGQWEYSQLYRDHPSSLALGIAKYGVWIGELTRHMRDSISGRDRVKYRHNVAHDGSMALLLAILQVEDMVWPGMGAEVVFEVWRKDMGPDLDRARLDDVYVRVLWMGKVLRSSSPILETLDMVPLERILAYFDELVGMDASLVKQKCASGTSL